MKPCKVCARSPADSCALAPDLLFRRQRAMNVWTKEVAGNLMRIETKYLHLSTPVTLGSRFHDWQVCWLGDWGKHRMYYLVMLAKVTR
jgi:hypothetical protein